MPSDYSSLTDEQLAELINSGRYDYFPELIGRLMPHIKSAAIKWKSVVFDTDDLIEEGVVAVFSAIKSFDSEKASFQTFAKLCVDRAIAVKVRSAGAGKRIPSGLISSMDEQSSATVESAEEQVIRREEDSIFHEDIKKSLTELERSVLECFLGGDSYAQIAEKLSVTVKSVDSALQRVRGKLKK